MRSRERAVCIIATVTLLAGASCSATEGAEHDDADQPTSHTEPSNHAAAGSSVTVTAGRASADAGPPALRCDPASVYGDPLPSIEKRAADLVVSGFHACDGPLWVPKMAALFFSDTDYGAGSTSGGPASTVRALTPTGAVVEFIPNSGSTGLGITPDGEIVAAAFDTRGLAKFDLIQRARTDFVTSFEGKRFNSPQGVTVSDAGNLYFTDPTYHLDGRPAELGVTGVYRVSPAHEVSLIEGALTNPNGIALNADDTLLYVTSEDGEGRVSRFHLAPDGSASPSENLIAVQHPAGITTDCAGNLYVATGFGGQVVVFDPKGEMLGAIGVGPPTTNVAFGGADAKTLFITTGGASPALFAIELAVPGPH